MNIHTDKRRVSLDKPEKGASIISRDLYKDGLCLFQI